MASYRCQRCGKLFRDDAGLTINDRRHDVRLENTMGISIYAPFGNPYYQHDVSDPGIDLCPDCMEGIVEYLGLKKTDWGEELGVEYDLDYYKEDKET